MNKLQRFWNDWKYLFYLLSLPVLVMIAIMVEDHYNPPKPQPAKESVTYDIQKFQTTTVGGRLVTCFERGVRGGLSCVPERD